MVSLIGPFAGVSDYGPSTHPHTHYNLRQRHDLAKSCASAWSVLSRWRQGYAGRLLPLGCPQRRIRERDDRHDASRRARARRASTSQRSGGGSPNASCCTAGHRQQVLVGGGPSHHDAARNREIVQGFGQEDHDLEPLLGREAFRQQRGLHRGGLAPHEGPAAHRLVRLASVLRRRHRSMGGPQWRLTEKAAPAPVWHQIQIRTCAPCYVPHTRAQ